MSLQSIRRKAAALHHLPPKVEMILLEKKGYSGFSSAFFSLASRSRNAVLVRRGPLLRGSNVSI